jgi:hypothetical protein
MYLVEVGSPFGPRVGCCYLGIGCKSNWEEEVRKVLGENNNLLFYGSEPINKVPGFEVFAFVEREMEMETEGCTYDIKNIEQL